MSSIAGIVRFDGQRVDQSVLGRMSNALKIYGPDSQGRYCAASVGFTRNLLRTTPEDHYDVQPLLHPESRSILVFDGRIDNRKELAKALGIDQAGLAKLSDSALVLRAFLHWGDDALPRMIGDFAVAFWRNDFRRLVLARDFLGNRPLFWCKRDDFFAFASMPKGLFCIPGIEKALSGEALHDFLCLIPFKNQQTFYEGIRKVDPGQKIVVTNGVVNSTDYYEFKNRGPIKFKDDSEYIDAFHEKFKTAVSRMSRRIGPLGVELSSGLDSSSVAATVARIFSSRGDEQIKAFTLGPREGFTGKVPRGRHADESQLATSMTDMYSNIEHYIVRSDGKVQTEGLDEFIDILDRPPLNACNARSFREMRAVAANQGVKVLLSGFYGNFTLSYNGESYPASLIRKLRLLKLVHHIRQTKRVYPWLTTRWFLNCTVVPFVPGRMYKLLKYLKNGRHFWLDHSSIRPEVVDEMGTFQRSLKAGVDLTYRVDTDGWRARVNGVRLVDMGEYRAADNALGLEVRSPLGDRDLVEFCLAVPESQYWHNGEMQSFVKRCMKGRIPDGILSSKTKGLQSSDWYESFVGSVGHLRQDLEFLSADDTVSKFVDLDELESLLAGIDVEKMGDLQSEKKYRLKFLRGVSTGRFIRMVNRGNF